MGGKDGGVGFDRAVNARLMGAPRRVGVLANAAHQLGRMDFERTVEHVPLNGAVVFISAES